MDIFTLLFYLHCLAIGISAIVGIARLKMAPPSLKALCILMICVALSELAASFCGDGACRENTWIYNIYTFTEFILFCFYFRLSVDIFRKGKLLPVVCTVTVLAGIINFIFIQPFNTWTSNFDGIAMIVLIGLSFAALYRLMLYDPLSNPRNNLHYYILIVILLNCLVTFANWGMADKIARLYGEGINLYIPIQGIQLVIQAVFIWVLLMFPRFKRTL